MSHTSHNSFDIEQTPEGFRSASHNFKDCVGEGQTERDAVRDMDRKIVYLADNYPDVYRQMIRERLKAGLECACGHKLDSPVLAVVGVPVL